jgi:YidC/Oxa1 family membrane protein insertase
MSVFTHVLMSIADLLRPLCGGGAAVATGAAIVLFTVAVRLALHPLARAAARGEKVRARLAPQVAELGRRHKGYPQKLQRAMSDLYANEGMSPFAGMLPLLAQLPVFFLLYRVSSAVAVGGRFTDALRDGGILGARGLVFLGLFAVIAAVAGWTYRRAPKGEGVARYVPLLSFGTLVTAAVVPLAVGLYLATTTAWTAAERAWLQRPADGKGLAGAAPAIGGSDKTSDDRPHRT